MMSPLHASMPQAARTLPDRLWTTKSRPATAVGGGDGVVRGVSVDEDDLVDTVGHTVGDVGQVLRLVHRGDDHRNGGPVLPYGGFRPTGSSVTLSVRPSLPDASCVCGPCRCWVSRSLLGVERRVGIRGSL